jgi:hypothetical protein
VTFPDLPLGALPFGDIAHDGQQATMRSDGDALQIDLDPEEAAGSVLRQPLKQLRCPRDRLPHQLERMLLRVGRDTGAQVLHGEVQRLVSRVPVHVGHLPVDVEDGTGRRVMDEDGVVGGIENGAVVRLGVIEGTVGHFRCG